MSRLGAAVHVVTTAGPGGKTGATATAVCSVSDAPPTLLMCLNRRSQTNPIVVENGVFCVNTLGAGEAEIADIFAGRTGVMGTDRFNNGEWITLDDRQPGARVGSDCVRLPHRRGALGRKPQCVLRRGGIGAAWPAAAPRLSITSALTSACKCAIRNSSSHFRTKLARAIAAFLS